MTLKQYLIVETLKADHFDAEYFRLNPKDRMLPNGPNEQYSRMEKIGVLVSSQRGQKKLVN